LLRKGAGNVMAPFDLPRTSAALSDYNLGISRQNGKRGSRMKTMTAKKAKNTVQNVSENDRTSLDRCYGQIGISAVAAAVRYQGAAKNPAYAPVAIKWTERAEEAA
jgi:hypothetical protein